MDLWVEVDANEHSTFGRGRVKANIFMSLKVQMMKGGRSTIMLIKKIVNK